MLFSLRRLLQILFLSVLSLISARAWASPGTLTFQTKIVKPNGDPLEEPSVYFKLYYTDVSGACVLYAEEFSSVSMSGSQGRAVLLMGSGTKVYPPAAVTLNEVFNYGQAQPCQGGGSVTPASTDRRKVIMAFNDGSGLQTLPAVAVNSVPYSLHSNFAMNANQLGGLSSADYTRKTELVTCSSGQALRYNGSIFVCENLAPALSQANATTSGFLSSADWSLFNSKQAALGFIPLNPSNNLSDLGNAATARTNLGLGTAAVVNTGTSSGNVPVLDGSGKVASSVLPTSLVTSSTAATGDLTGTYPGPTVSTVGTKTAAQISAAVTDTQAATSSASGNTLVKRNASGDASFAALDLNGSGAVVKLKVHSSSSSYDLTLPANAGSSGQVLSTNGSGDLAWVPAAGGGVTGVTASGPLSSSGGTTPNITIAKADASNGGYLSSADWSLFNSKLGSLASADITAALTFNPLNPANNLSDLGSASTARANLGLGSAAVLNTGTASGNIPVLDGSGKVAVSVLPSASGDVTGSWTALTVAAVGGKTSAQISTSVTDTLNATRDIVGDTLVRRNASGDASFGAVGIGTTGPTAPLDVRTAGGPGFTMMNSDGVAYGGVYVDGGFTPGPVQFGSYTNHNVGFFTNNALPQMTLTVSGDTGIGTDDPQSKLDVRGSVRVGIDAGACSAANDGAIRNNSGVIEFCQGASSTWTAFSVSGSTVTTVTAGGPLASSGGATPNITLAKSDASNSGYLSSADWSIFNNKLGTSLASGSIWIGNSGTATAQTLSGDATLSSGGNLSLVSVVTAGTASKITYDAKGRVTGGAALASNDITAALTFNPLNAANNLSDLGNAGAARSNLGLGTAATVSTGSASGNVPVLGVGGLVANQMCVANSGGTGIICNSTIPSGGGVQSAITTVGVISDPCSTPGQLGKTAGDDLVVCDDTGTFSGTDCSALGVGSITFDINGDMYVCTN